MQFGIFIMHVQIVKIELRRKQDFGLENFCLNDFWAPEASFGFIMVAYNIMSLFRHFALQSHNKATLATLKVYCSALTWSVNHAKKRY
jgi:hypothetical protein